MMNKILKWFKCFILHRPVMSGRYKVISQGITNHKVKCTLCGCNHWATTATGPK